MHQITVLAKTIEVRTVSAFVDGILEKMNCPMKAQLEIDVAIDEIFSNIANYAYGDKKGDATITVEELAGKTGICMSFSDTGAPYDPLAKPDPDITLSADDRPIGGLGIYIVKKTMDKVSYSYENGHNILTITKYF